MAHKGIEQLRLLTEQFELIRTILKSSSKVQAKVAIILLDSIADSLLYDRAMREFQRQSALSTIQRPKYDLDKREKVRRDFKQKVESCS